MFLVKNNSSGISSVDYAKKNSKCSYQGKDTNVKAMCSLTIYNYGKEDRITIRPLLTNSIAEIEFDPKTISVLPHQRIRLDEEFYGKIKNGTGFRTGSSQEIGIEIIFGRTKKILD